MLCNKATPFCNKVGLSRILFPLKRRMVIPHTPWKSKTVEVKCARISPTPSMGQQDLCASVAKMQRSARARTHTSPLLLHVQNANAKRKSKRNERISTDLLSSGGDRAHTATTAAAALRRSQPFAVSFILCLVVVCTVCVCVCVVH